MLVHLGAVEDSTLGEVHEEELRHLKEQDGVCCDRFMTAG